MKVAIKRLLSKYLYKDMKAAIKARESLFLRYKGIEAEYVINYSGAWGEKEIFRKTIFQDYILVPFEDIYAKVPIGYDECLQNLYGDYMKLPPKEDRVSHHFTEVIDLDNSYTKYIK